MKEKVSENEISARVNAKSYDNLQAEKYIDGAPHVKHKALQDLYRKLVTEIYNTTCTSVSRPKVLDLGAGDGSATLCFLELGAEVTAVDISRKQLDTLKNRTSSHNNNLSVCQGDVNSVIEEIYAEGTKYDIVVANSFLHHIPDYLTLIRQCSMILSPQGQFFSFQDPLKYDSLGKFTKSFCEIAYLSWRFSKGDLINGIKRRLRRKSGVYSKDDNAEYHVVRGGVDQDAIYELFKELGLQCRIIRYFSTQSRIWQPVGTAMKTFNTFSIIAKKETLKASV